MAAIAGILDATRLKNVVFMIENFKGDINKKVIKDLTAAKKCWLQRQVGSCFKILLLFYPPAFTVINKIKINFADISNNIKLRIYYCVNGLKIMEGFWL